MHDYALERVIPNQVSNYGQLASRSLAQNGCVPACTVFRLRFVTTQYRSRLKSYRSRS